MSKVWLITGSSRGFGRVWAIAALERGDRVIATARNPELLQDLKVRFGAQVLVVALDVCNRASVEAAVKTGVEVFGRIDVVINNAGYGLFCPLESVPEIEANNILDTNLLGSLRVIQEVLPVMRRQQAGHIVQISSIAGLISLPGMGMYNASKWAVEGMVESLALEVKEFGIDVTLVEPGPHMTDWIGSSAIRPERGSVYPSHEHYMHNCWPRTGLGSAESTVAPMLQLIDCDSPPLRLLVGEGLDALVKDVYQERLNDWACVQ